MQRERRALEVALQWVIFRVRLALGAAPIACEKCKAVVRLLSGVPLLYREGEARSARRQSDQFLETPSASERVRTHYSGAFTHVLERSGHRLGGKIILKFQPRLGPVFRYRVGTF